MVQVAKELSRARTQISYVSYSVSVAVDAAGRSLLGGVQDGSVRGIIFADSV